MRNFVDEGAENIGKLGSDLVLLSRSVRHIVHTHRHCEGSG